MPAFRVWTSHDVKLQLGFLYFILQVLRGVRTRNEPLGHSFTRPGRVLLQGTKMCLVGNRTINLHVTSRANFRVLSQLESRHAIKARSVFPFLVCSAPGLSRRAHARLYSRAPLTTASSCGAARRVRSSGVSSPRVSQKNL